MSSKSSSSQSTSQTDNRRVLGEGSVSSEVKAGASAATNGGIVAGGYSKVTVLDNGAINRAFDFSQNVGSAALGFAQSTAGQVAEAYKDAKGRTAMNDYILIGAIAMAGLVAYSAVKK